MTRPHLTLGRLAAISASLAPRDLEVVASLARLRLATSPQLERLHFAEGSRLTQARRCRRTLERLVGLGVLARLDRRIGGARSGSAGFVYALGAAGQRLNGGHGPAGGRRIRKPWTPSLPFVAHVLAVTELYVRLVEVERVGGVELLGYDAEPQCWRRFSAPGGGTAILKPDAYAVLGKGDYEEHRFIEVDRATESLTTIGTKLRAYRQYWMTGREQQARGLFPGVLFIVPDEQRRQHVLDECGRQPADAWQLFQVVVWQGAVSAMTGDGHD